MPNHPLVSFVVLAYKQERYIREAVQSALAQTYEPLEILITDDCSPDRTFDIIQEEVAAYRGRHRVIVNRNSQNMGLSRSINKAWELTHGELLVVQAGDDASLPRRTEELARVWHDANPRPDLICSNILVMDENSTVIEENRQLNWQVTLESVIATGWAAVSGCACAYSRHIQEYFGALDGRVLQEDAVYPFRALLGNGILGVDLPLVRYRTHDQNLSRPDLHPTKKAVRDCAWFLRWRLNQLAVMEEWLRAYRLVKGVGDLHYRNLKRLANIRSMDYSIRSHSLFRAIPDVALCVLHGAPIRYGASLSCRRLLGLLDP